MTLELQNTRIDEFLDKDVYERFTFALSALDNWQTDDIRIFSIQSSGSQTNITFAVQHDQRMERLLLI